MIEDKELRDLFKTEAGEHVQRLSDGLLRLEKDPKESAALEEVFREAHSLKGAARMVGVVDVEEMAHKLEDMFGAVKKGAVTLTSEIIDSMFKTLDTIRKLVHEAVTGEKAEVRVLEVQPEAKIAPPPPFEKEGMGGFGEFKIETVRVDTKMLDALMTQTGELTVTKAHISSRIAEIDEIIEIEEELEKRNVEFGVRSAELKSKLQNLKSKIGGDNSRLDFISDRLDDGVRKIRLIPISTIFNLFPKIQTGLMTESERFVSSQYQPSLISSQRWCGIWQEKSQRR